MKVGDEVEIFIMDGLCYGWSRSQTEYRPPATGIERSARDPALNRWTIEHIVGDWILVKCFDAMREMAQTDFYREPLKEADVDKCTIRRKVHRRYVRYPGDEGDRSLPKCGTTVLIQMPGKRAGEWAPAVVTKHYKKSIQVWVPSAAKFIKRSFKHFIEIEPQA